MSHVITIRTSGNAIDISPDGKSELPTEVKTILEPQLCYTYIRVLRGANAYDWAGHRKPISTEIRNLYDYDKYGRMVCGAGLSNRIEKLLKACGYEVVNEDCNSTHHRPDRFIEDWDNLAKNYSFLARQEEVITAVASNNRGIIDAPTGAGKSHMFRAICLLYPKARIIITTKRKDLVQGTRAYLTSHLPNVGQVGGGINEPSRITVVTADSLHRISSDDCDIILADEVHELAAPSYSRELAKFRQSRMFGFTATPDGRMDNADMKLESLFGTVIFSMSYQEAVDLALVVPIHVRWLDVMLSDNPASGRVDVPRQRWGIWRNNGRNEIIANTAREFTADEQVLIMVTTFDHAVHLRQFLPEFTLCYAERNDDEDFNRYVKSGMLPADEPIMTAERRQILRRQFEKGELKKVIATDVWSTGVNFHQLSVLMRADARSSEIMDAQIPGRVCRKHEQTGKQYGLVIDCLDQFDSGFREAARKRRRNYESKQWIQILPTSNQRITSR